MPCLHFSRIFFSCFCDTLNIALCLAFATAALRGSAFIIFIIISERIKYIGMRDNGLH